MAASNSTGGTGRKNFYRVSYGKLSTRLKEAPEGYTELLESSLKSSTQNVEQLDLRNKFVKKDGDFPMQVFYDTLEGQVTSVEKDEYDKGVSLVVKVEDSDGDESVLQMDFYNKYAENLLNRLLSVKDTSSDLVFTPYAIPNESDIDGKKIKYYNQGVSLKENGQKVEMTYKAEDKELPKTERIKNAKGVAETSRVARVDFLFDKVSQKFVGASPQEEKSNGKEVKPHTPTKDDYDDLPF